MSAFRLDVTIVCTLLANQKIELFWTLKWRQLHNKIHSASDGTSLCRVCSNLKKEEKKDDSHLSLINSLFNPWRDTFSMTCDSSACFSTVERSEAPMGLNNYSQDLSQFVWIYLLKLNLMRKIIILCHIPEDFLWKLVLENILNNYRLILGSLTVDFLGLGTSVYHQWVPQPVSMVLLLWKKASIRKSRK